MLHALDTMLGAHNTASWLQKVPLRRLPSSCEDIVAARERPGPSGTMCNSPKSPATQTVTEVRGTA